MFQNVKANKYKSIESCLYTGNYYDYALYNGDTYTASDYKNHEIIDISCPFTFINNRLYSNSTWKEAINNGVKLEDIGFTGVDNGFIHFDKRRISNQDFLKLYTSSTFEISSGDTRLFLTPITGNTQRFSYPLYYHEDEKDCYLSFRGGFYQGFFKLYGFKYEILPVKQLNDWVFNFEIRPRNDYKLQENIINNLHPENYGIFFFMGLRGENKMWQYFNSDSDEFIIDKNHQDEHNPKDEYYAQNEPDYFENNEYTDEKYSDINCDNSKYYKDNYFDTPPCAEGDRAIEPPYMEKDIEIDEDKLKDIITDSDGHIIGKKGYYEIESDNKFLLFDRTPSGVTTETYTEGMAVKLQGYQDWDNINLFPLMNRTETGWTTNSINDFYQQHRKKYDFYEDTKNNVFALRVTKDGRIGYRYGILDCDKEKPHYSLVEEYSKEGIVKFNEWNKITVRIALLDAPSDKCDNLKRKMKIMIYVNGFLKFISRELDCFEFREQNTVYQLQEGVPYNISLGGGTLGLLEMITLDYYKVSNHLLPIEKDFCGTFIGDIKTFKMYNCFIDYSTIKDYLS